MLTSDVPLAIKKLLLTCNYLMGNSGTFFTCFNSLLARKVWTDRSSFDLLIEPKDKSGRRSSFGFILGLELNMSSKGDAPFLSGRIQYPSRLFEFWFSVPFDFNHHLGCKFLNNADHALRSSIGHRGVLEDCLPSNSLSLLKTPRPLCQWNRTQCC